MLRPDIEQVEWIDSKCRGGWIAVEDVIEELESEDCSSVGYVLAEDTTFLYMSATISEDGCLCPFSIPLTSIIERRLLVAGESETT
jgi:hypothetical protein